MLRLSLIIWARRGRPCEICLIYDSVLISSTQTIGDRLYRYMDLASPPWIVNSRYIFEEYHVYTVESSWYSEAYHFMVSYCIASTTSFVLDDYVFIGGWKVLEIYLPLFDELDLVCCCYWECLFVKVVIV